MELKYFCKDHSWQVDIDEGLLYHHGKEFPMTPGASKVIHYLVTHPDATCSYKDLYTAMKKDQPESLTPKDLAPDYNRAISDLFDDQIRQCPYFDYKYKKEIDGHQYIKLVRGKGLCFMPSEDIALHLLIDRDISTGSGGVTPCEDYCGREQDLQILRDKAFPEGENANLFVLSGEAGIGKSELARAFIQDCMRADAPERLCYRKVLWTTFDRNFKTTVETLPCDSLSLTRAFDRRIDALRNLPGPKLLVIDNVDTIEEQDLNFNNPILQKLFSTDCHILLTSKIDLAGYHPAVRQHIVQPIGTDQLTRLFFNKCKYIGEDQTAAVEDLIENYLCSNTYLTVLAAGISEWHSVAEIKAHFDALKISKMDMSYVFSHKHGSDPEVLSLFEHFCHLFQLAKLDKRQKILLLHLALLPIGGVPVKWLFKYAFDDSTIPQANKDLLFFRQHYFCFITNKDGQPWIRIQPMLREVILRSSWAPGDKDYIHRYLSGLIHKLDLPYYHSELPQVLQASTAAAAALRIMPDNFLNSGKMPLYTQLLNQIVSVFDILKDNASIEAYVDEAILWLDKVQPQMWTWEKDRKDILRYLTACNNLAYPLSHIGRTDASDTLYRTAIDIIRRHQAKALDDSAFIVKASKIYNNLGANYAKAGDYQKALSIHMEVLDHRRQYSDAIADRQALLAASHKAVGTDLYHLNDFAESFSYHTQAVSLYHDTFGRDSLEYITALIRMIGAGIGSGRKECYAQWLSQLTCGLQYLQSIEFVESEVVYAINHAANMIGQVNTLQEEGAIILQIALSFPKTDKLMTAIQDLDAVL